MNYDLINSLARYTEVDKIVWGHSQVFLPLVIILFVAQGIFYISVLRRRYDAIYVGDALLAPLGIFFKRIIRKPVVCIAHGLDIMFKPAFYQTVVIPSVKKCDVVVCVSRNTQSACIERGLPQEKLVVIPNGVSMPAQVKIDESLHRMRENGFVIPKDSRILLTVARLVKRKGVSEFIEKVFISLAKERPNLFYCIIGDGSKRLEIEDIVRRNNLHGRIFLRSNVKEETLHDVYAIADIFVMPNIKVENDVEGFGIVALEAASFGVPVVAFDIDGITDAVRDAESGFLVPAGDYGLLKEKISVLLEDEKMRALLSEGSLGHAKKFSWEDIGRRYLDVVQEKTAVAV